MRRPRNPPRRHKGQPQQEELAEGERRRDVFRIVLIIFAPCGGGYTKSVLWIFLTRLSLEFSPDNTKTFLESIQKHIDSNLSQFFIGGAIARIRATEEPNWVIVEVINYTSRKSLMFHIANNYEREKGKIVPLSTIGQRIIFKMKIDTNKFYK